MHGEEKVLKENNGERKHAYFVLICHRQYGTTKCKME